MSDIDAAIPPKTEVAQHPHRQRQLPAQYRSNSENEAFNAAFVSRMNQRDWHLKRYSG